MGIEEVRKAMKRSIMFLSVTFKAEEVNFEVTPMVTSLHLHLLLLLIIKPIQHSRRATNTLLIIP